MVLALAVMLALVMFKREQRDLVNKVDAALEEHRREQRDRYFEMLQVLRLEHSRTRETVKEEMERPSTITVER